MTDQNYTVIGVVLDKSSSMNSVRDATISGFNEFLMTQKEAEGRCDLTLVQFSDTHETTHDMVNVHDVPELTEDTYRPSGMTALLDAIGTTIDSIGTKLAEMPEEERPAKVVIAVLTDGQENQSREYTRDQIFNSITVQQDTFSWEFVFLGAGQDAIAAGQQYGFMASKSVTYSAGKTSQTLSHLGDKVRGLRRATARGASMDMSYSQEDRNEVGE